jgi:hypothetical protein
VHDQYTIGLSWIGSRLKRNAQNIQGFFIHFPVKKQGVWVMRGQELHE